MKKGMNLKQASATIARWLGQESLNFAFPPFCCSCDEPTERSEFICKNCLLDIDLVDEYEIEDDLSHILANGDIQGIFALWTFDRFSPASRLHQLLKYNNRPYVGPYLGRLIGEAYNRHRERNRGLSDAAHVVVPIPLHRLRYLERGYNQAERLASGFCQVADIQLDTSILARSRGTVSQTGLTIQQRLENVGNVFTVLDPADVVGRSVIILDDVLTTGATVASAATVLRAAGASSISIVALAFTRPG